MSAFPDWLPKSRGDSTQSEMIRRLRLGNLRKLLRDRNGPILPDDDAGREYLVELLLPISVGPHAAIKMPNAVEVWAPWMQHKEAEAIIDQINLMPIWQRKPTARVLGERLRVCSAKPGETCDVPVCPSSGPKTPGVGVGYHRSGAELSLEHLSPKSGGPWKFLGGLAWKI